MRGEIGLSYCRSEGQGRVFQGCSVRSAPALIHYGTSVFFLPILQIRNPTNEQERSRRTHMSPEEQQLLQSHQLGGRISLMEAR